MTETLRKWIPRRGYTIYYKILIIIAVLIALFSPKLTAGAFNYVYRIEDTYPTNVELGGQIYEEPIIEKEPTIREMVETEFGVGHVMNRIASCESNFRQHNENGEPLYNAQGSSAVGVFQIMTSYHLERARELNLDIINDPLDNIAFAIILYNEQDVKPWMSSYKCWSE